MSAMLFLTHYSLLITSFDLEINGDDVLADAATEVGGGDVVGVDCVGFESGAVAERGDEAGVVRARQAQHVEADREALNLRDDLRQAAQERDVLAPLLVADFGFVF